MSIHVATSERGARRHRAFQWLVVAYASYLEWRPDGDVESFVDWLNDNAKELAAAAAEKANGG